MSNDEGDWISLTDEEMEKYMELFYEPERFTQEEVAESANLEVFFL